MSESMVAGRELPLAAYHRRQGAVFAPAGPGIPGGDVAAPLHYGSVADEYAALRRGCGLLDRSSADRLELTGADRLRFLNAYLTCDVKSIAPGQGAYGFATSPQGRILADAVLLARQDRLWMELPAGAAAAMAQHLGKFIIADRVEIRPLEEMLPLTLIGPRAATALREALDEEAAGELPAEPWRHMRARVHGFEVTLQRRGRHGEDAWAVWVSTADAEAVIGKLADLPGVRLAGSAAAEILRVEAGIPRFGLDFGPQNFPQETGEEAAVSYTKGCYLGQEVVARIHYRGGVQKTLCGLVFSGTAGPPAAGTPLLYEGREAGGVGSAVESPALGLPAGLAILHRRAAAPGTRLDLAPGGAAEVRELPLVRP
jgi:folate-binding protein YgfZ